MANIRQIKRRIQSAKNIAKITGAMQMVAASKMKRAQNQALESRAYAQALESSLKKIARFVDPSLHPLLSRNAQGQELLIVVSTDKGLCGSLNTNILKGVLEWRRQHPQAAYVAVGKKAVMLCRLFGLPLLAQFTQLPEKITTADVLPITELVKQNYLDKTIQSVDIIYTDFINTLSQQVAFSQLLPIYKTAIVEDSSQAMPMINPNYAFEPDPRSLLNALLPYFIENKLYQVMLEARASEHSARMVAMKNASENAHELVGELQLMFNKSRQASITNELLDITTSTLTLNN